MDAIENAIAAYRQVHIELMAVEGHLTKARAASDVAIETERAAIEATRVAIETERAANRRHGRVVARRAVARDLAERMIRAERPGITADELVGILHRDQP